MSVLLLRLAGPMQSWGLQSRFSDRDTGMEPSKSGVIGLIAAALGRARSDSIHDLSCLKMGVRVDREGIIKDDFQTALNVIKADQKSRDTVISHRHFLCNAVFLVGLEGSEDFLLGLEKALRNPTFELFLGRKSYVPSQPVIFASRPDGWDGPKDAPNIVRGELHDVLCRFPFLINISSKNRYIRLMVESPNEGSLRNDNPISFADRIFSSRYVKTEWIDITKLASIIFMEEENYITQKPVKEESDDISLSINP